MNMIPAQMQIPGLDMTANLHSVATEVLCLMNMVEVEELMDDEEYEGKSSTDVVLLFEGIGHLSPLLPTSLSNRPLSKCIEEHRDGFEVEGTNLHLPLRKQVLGKFENVPYSSIMRFWQLCVSIKRCQCSQSSNASSCCPFWLRCIGEKRLEDLVRK